MLQIWTKFHLKTNDFQAHVRNWNIVYEMTFAACWWHSSERHPITWRKVADIVGGRVDMRLRGLGRLPCVEQTCPGNRVFFRMNASYWACLSGKSGDNQDVWPDSSELLQTSLLFDRKPHHSSPQLDVPHNHLYKASDLQVASKTVIHKQLDFTYPPKSQDNFTLIHWVSTP